MNAIRKPPFIAGNWKMHMTIPEARELARSVVRDGLELPEAELVLIPPFTALSEVRKVIDETPVQLGAQNLFWEEKGAYTGEISAPMLMDIGCRYVVIGHSERRLHFGEKDDSVNKKVKAALKFGLMPIMCLGESLEEREKGLTMEKVESQLTAGLDGLKPEEAGRVIIAYEPVWAIGTGKNATPDQAEEVHVFIKEKLAEKYGKHTADCVIILYGGSVKPSNAYALFREKNIEGFLVGGASLEAVSFIQISKEAVKAEKEKHWAR